MPRRKWVALDAYVRKKKVSEKLIQASRRRDYIRRRKLKLKSPKEIIKITTEINKHTIENNRKKKKIESCFFEKTDKSLKPLARLTKKKEKRTCN